MVKSLDDVAEAFLHIWLAKPLDIPAHFDIASLSIDDAYEVQRQVIVAREARGEQVVGEQRMSPAEVDFDLEGVGLFRNGQPLLSASGMKEKQRAWQMEENDDLAVD